MFRTDRWKLNVYHGNEYGELYDMVEDPNELNNLWEHRDFQDVKHRLIRQSFDATTVGQAAPVPRMGRF